MSSVDDTFPIFLMVCGFFLLAFSIGNMIDSYYENNPTEEKIIGEKISYEKVPYEKVPYIKVPYIKTPNIKILNVTR